MPAEPVPSEKAIEPNSVESQAQPAELHESDPPAVARLKERAPRDLRAQKQLAAVSVLFVATFVVAVYLPSVRRLSELHERIVTGAQQLQSNRDRGRALPELRARAENLESQVESFKPLAAESEVAAIVNQTVGFGSLSQLREFNQQQQEPSIDGALGTWPIRMTFEGNFENVYSFLRRCEQVPFSVRISELSVKQKPGTPGAPAHPGEVMVSMVLNVHYRPEPVASVD